MKHQKYFKEGGEKNLYIKIIAQKVGEESMLTEKKKTNKQKKDLKTKLLDCQFRWNRAMLTRATVWLGGCTLHRVTETGVTSQTTVGLYLS